MSEPAAAADGGDQAGAPPIGTTDASGAGDARALLGLQRWMPSRAVLATVAILGLLGGLAEAYTLGLVASIGATLAQGSDVVELGVGPVDLSTSVAGALLVGLTATAAMVATRLVASRLGSNLAATTLVTTRTTLLREYLHASYEVQREVLQAELHDLVTFQAMRLAQAALMVAVALTNGLAFVAMVGVAVLFDPVTGGLLIGFAIVLAGVFLPLIRRSNKAGGAHLHSQVQVGVELGDVTGLLAETHVYGAADGMLTRSSRSIAAAGRAFRTAGWVSQVTPTLYLGAVLVILLGGLAGLNAAGVGDLQTVGAILLLTLRGLRYSQQAQANVQVAVEQAPNVVSVTAASDRFRASAVGHDGRPLDRIETLELRGVGYTHAGTVDGIHDVDLTLRRGEIVGVVGHSGAGKSTFAEVLLGLRDPERGQVLVNGEARGEVHPRAWFDRVAYVGQDARLLVGSVADNVAFFRDVEAGEVDRALAAASMVDDLERWAEGRDREVGSGGRDVSGGQRQRIAIARALAGRPDLVVMDEPTSALDPESEERIRASLAALAGEVLVVVVAHRRSTLEVCDRIVRFEDGRASEVAAAAVDDAVDELDA